MEAASEFSGPAIPTVVTTVQYSLLSTYIRPKPSCANVNQHFNFNSKRLQIRIDRQNLWHQRGSVEITITLNLDQIYSVQLAELDQTKFGFDEPPSVKHLNYV